MSYVAFKDAAQVGDRFLDLLHRHGIQPASRSHLEAELLSLSELIEITKNPALAEGLNESAVLRSAAGLHDLAAKILSVETLPEFQTFVPHLRLIAESGVKSASLGQNAASGPFDDTARKMAELYLGSLVAHFGWNVELDSPVAAKGDNPDVLCTLTESEPETVSRRWAFAVKTISSHQGQTIYERIRDGAAQIDAANCPADCGMIVINTKSALDHDALWNASFNDLESANDALGAQIRALVEAAQAGRSKEEWDLLFAGRAKRPVLFLGQSLVKVPTMLSALTLTALKQIVVFDAEGAYDATALSAAREMNDLMQTILFGNPGGPGRSPS